MNTPPSGPSVILSSAEPLHSKGSDARFPYATAYAGIQVVLLGLLIFPGLAIGAVHNTGLRLIAQLAIFLPIEFFVFRWAINKHIVGNVTLTTTALIDYGKRFSFKNPFLAGFIAYLAINMLASTVVDPIQKMVVSNLEPAKFILDLLIGIVIGYFAFTLAVKRVVLKPYRAKRLMPLLGLVVALALLIPTAISLAEARQEWAFQNHLYCEVLKPGMTQTEVSAGLGEYDLSFQLNLKHEFKGPGAENVTVFTMPRFKDRNSFLNLELVLGYDSADKLMMVGQWDLGAHEMTYIPVKCPLPFLQ